MQKILMLISLISVSVNICFSQAAHSVQLPQKQDSLALQYAKTIGEADLKNYLSILASDALEGRDTGSRGQKMAAAFIREHFRDNNLRPMIPGLSDSLYFQKFDLFRNYYRDIYIEANGIQYLHLEDLLYSGNTNIPSPREMTLHFVGNGAEKDYLGLNVAHGMVAFFADSREEMQIKLKIARDHGAVAYFAVNADKQSEFNNYIEKNAQYFESTSISIEQEEAGENLLFLGSFELLAKLLAVDLKKLDKVMDKKSKASKNPLVKIRPGTVMLKIEKISEKFETENVLGLIEGSDRKDELLVITAHYDHVGKQGDLIFNGADDDASGTSALMEMAQAFALAKTNGHGPRRSLLFMTVTGEEKGLLGSEFYSNHPAWPLDKTVANLNIDMIGRVDPAHEEQDQYVYVIGSDMLSTDLHLINEKVNKLYTQLDLDYKYNAADDPHRFYYRSDHYNFAKHNIPIIFYFNGTHADYHQATDTIEKIRFDLLKKRTDLVFYCAWELANREERIRLD